MKRSTETRRCPAEINADSQRHYGGLAELPTDKKASENFHRPAYQACELIRKSSELFSESVEERMFRVGINLERKIEDFYNGN